MTDRSTIADMLRDLSDGALQLDDQGQCIIQSPDGIVFRIEVPAAGDQVYWIAPLGPHRGARDGAVSARLLQEGFLALETRGAHLSVDPRAQEIVLWTSQPMAGLAATTFEKVTVNFADLAAHWVQRLAEWRQAEPAAQPEERLPDDAEMISFRI